MISRSDIIEALRVVCFSFLINLINTLLRIEQYM